MLTLYQHQNNVTVHYNGQNLGQIDLSHNPYHQTRTYLTLNLISFPLDMAEQLFQSLLQTSELSFQVMPSSLEQEKISFLTAGGFTCHRKCFEVELSQPLEPLLTHPIHEGKRGQEDFTKAAQLMFSHYQATHQAINPWTAGLERFEELLPDTVLYTKQDSKVTNLAFVEDNEIAYMTGQDLQDFRPFISQVSNALFSQYEVVTTEIDDCDPYAMTIFDLYPDKPLESWDTYLLNE